MTPQRRIVVAALAAALIACDSATEPPPRTDVPGPLEIQVSAPYNFQLFQDSISISATCTGCRDLHARLQYGPGSGNWNSSRQALGSGHATVDTTVALQVDPGSYTVMFDAWNTAGEFVREWVHVVVTELPPSAELIVTVPGLIRDFDGERLAWVTERDNGVYGGPYALWIRTMATGEDVLLDSIRSSGPGEWPRIDLVPDGAFMLVDIPNISDLRGSARLVARKNGTVLRDHSAWFEDRAGAYYIWSDHGPEAWFGKFETRALWRGGPDGDVEVWPSLTSNQDLAPDGDVVFEVVSSDSTMLFSGDSLTLIARNATSPVTDGTLIAYTEQLPEGQRRLVLRNEDGTTEVVTEQVHGWRALRNGYLAWIEGWDRELWVRMPGGEKVRVPIPYKGGAWPVALGNAGELIIATTRRTVLATPPYDPAQLRKVPGNAFLVDGELFFFAGDSLFRL